MKALVLTAYNKFEYKDVPDPNIGPDEVLIEVRACGICGSDVHGMDGSTGRRRPPIIMGHEAAGVIAAVGTDVREWLEGDRVTFDSTIYCGACEYCRHGEFNLCDNRRVLGVSCDEYRRNGAFAHYVAVPERVLYRVPDSLAFEEASLVEPGSVALHAVKRAPIHDGQAAVVFGAGVIGLLIVQCLRIRCCSPIIAVDINESRLELAKALGADVTVNAEHHDPVAAVHECTHGVGTHGAWEAVGVTDTITQASRSVKKNGSVVLVGNIAPQAQIELQRLVTREIRLIGSCASAGEYAECLAMMDAGELRTRPMVSATAPLSDGAAWFDRLYMRDPNLVKVILAPEHENRE